MIPTCWAAPAGRVAAVVWEGGRYYREPGPRRDTLQDAIALLGRCGFRNMLARPEDAGLILYDLCPMSGTSSRSDRRFDARLTVAFSVA